MKMFKKYLWVFLILFVVIIFFYPLFKGQIPFPGDLLANVNPYNSNGYLGYQPGGFPNKAQGPDVISEIYPWRFFSIDQLKQFNIPFWNPYNFSGNPQMANFQTAVFYPFNILYFIFPFNVSWTLLIMFQPFLAGIFMYLFLKKGIGVEDFPSLVGAISFGFCSYMSVWMEYGNIGSTLLWLPLALLFVKYYFNNPDLKNIFILSLILSLSILAGYIQGAFYIFLLCFLFYNYLVFSTKGEFDKHKKNFVFLLSLVFPFILTAFQILPTLQLFLQSTRGGYSLSQIEKNLAPIFTWITIFIPDFFGNPATRNYWIDGTYIERVMYPGAVILFFAIYALFNKINFLEKKFFLIVSLVSLVIASNLPLVKYFYLIPIPVISTTIPTRELSIFIFSLIVLGSMGLDLMLKKKNIKLKAILVYISFFAITWICVLFISKFSQSFSLDLKVSQRNLILPTLFAVFIIFSIFLKRKRNFTKILLLAILIFDLFYFFEKITPFSKTDLVYPQTRLISYIQKNGGINRFWGYGSAYIPSNFQSVDKTFSTEGNDPLHISSYGELLSTSNNGKLPQSLPRPDANIASGYGASDLKTNFFRKRILDLLGVKYIINKQESKDSFNNPDFSTFPQEDYSLVFKSYPFQVYENKNSVPRFFVTPNYILAKNKQQELSFIYNPKIDLKKTLILQTPVKVKTDISSTGTAIMLFYSPSDIRIKTVTTGDTLLFLSDNYYSDWEVKVDEKRSTILLADYSFRAVNIPKGSHVVEFSYNPKSFYSGIIIASLGVFVLFILFIYVKKSKKN